MIFVNKKSQLSYSKFTLGKTKQIVYSTDFRFVFVENYNCITFQKLASCIILNIKQNIEYEFRSG